MFLDIGRAQGYVPRRSFSQHLPTDGVWLATTGIGRFHELPIVAIEVAASEGLKTWRGSLVTLEAVSPAVAILLLQDEEVRRRMSRAGATHPEIEETLGRMLTQMREAAARTRQRVEVYTMENLRYLHRVYVERH
ncbi:MAG TPA: hypothetical protein VE057_28595 [Archangium sp.]|nr:hypothetical protein [Archangium sp.]